MKNRFFSLLAAIALISACATTEADQTEAAEENASVTQTAKEEVKKAVDRVFFEFDRSDISADAIKVLKGQVAWLKANPNTPVVLEGHCDERGTREYNQALGERRADAVKKYMVANGIAASRIKTISYGKERPANPEHNEAAWAQNRRTVTIMK